MDTAGSVDCLEITYPAVAASVPRARNMLSAFAASKGVTEEQLQAVRLAVSEAVTNATQHAYAADTGDIHVTAAVACGELWVLIADNGCGLREQSDSPGLGLGLTWMAQFSDGLTLVRRSCGGLEARMRFILSTRALEPDDSPARVAGVC